ncbi:MAG: NUDIX domain-containing protein [Bacteroidales bacterium]|nr:NUDIX domain-containing protein [Bacteroidales bacterium]
MQDRSEIDNFSIDCVIFGFDKSELKALLIKRNTEPDFGKLALPGGFVYLDEDLDAAPLRRLYDMTGLTDIYMKQVGTFGKTDRYPLRRVITVVYYALVRVSNYSIKMGQDASEVHWVSVKDMPDLAFDHRELFDVALKKLQEQVRIDPIIFNLLPKEFSLSELQDVYEAITMQKFDKRNFRKKVLGFNFLVDTEKKQSNVSHRAARLYMFDKKAYQKMVQRGQMFTI